MRWRERGVSVTCLMPGATETDFFERADMLDTKVGQQKKDDPADVAKDGFDAMMRGDGDVVSGWLNKLQTAIASVTPAGVLGAAPQDGGAGHRPAELRRLTRELAVCTGTKPRTDVFGRVDPASAAASLDGQPLQTQR